MLAFVSEFTVYVCVCVCMGGGLLRHGHVLYTYLCHDIDIVIDVGILIDIGVIRTIFDMTSLIDCRFDVAT